MQKTARNQITLISAPEATVYQLLPSATYITVSTNGILSETTLTCKAYKIGSDYKLPVEVSNTEGILFYNTVTDGKMSAPQLYTEEGVAVSKSYNKIRFSLKLLGQAGYVAFVDVPIITNGQLDDKFQIWVGETPGKPADDYRPWDDGDDMKHVGDYYIDNYMRYYQFCYSYSHDPNYFWSEVTDEALLTILDRTDQNSRGYYISSGGPAQYFAKNEIEYKAGDVMTVVESTDPEAGVMYGKTHYCIRDMANKHFNQTDWVLLSLVDKRLLDSGIDVGRCTITMTTDNIRFKNNAGIDVAAINMYEGYPRINAELLYINSDVKIDGDVIANSIKGKELEINGTGTFTGSVKNSDGAWELKSDGSGQVANNNIAWDADGNLFIKNGIQNGVYNNLVTTITTGCDTLIPVYDSTDGNTQGSVIANDIDILKCGDVIIIDSHNGKQLRLPYYISSDFNNRTYTTIDGTRRLITIDEIHQLLGKKITLIVNKDLPVSQSIDGVLNLTVWNTSEDALDDVIDLVDWLTYNLRVFNMPGSKLLVGIYLRVYVLEFRPCLFVTNSGYKYTGYAWITDDTDSNNCTIYQNPDWGWVDPDVLEDE